MGTLICSTFGFAIVKLKARNYLVSIFCVISQLTVCILICTLKHPPCYQLYSAKKKTHNFQPFLKTKYTSIQPVMNACLQLAKTQPEAIFIAWFDETAETYKAFFTQNGIDEVRITTVGKFDPAILQHYQPVFL